jgi:hypothetical protein
MKTRMLSLILILIVASPAMSAEQSIEDKINALNTNTVNSLGISLTALSYLMKASPNSYIPLWHLKETGDISYIRELEKAGYVKVTIIKGLPDGQMQNQEQVNITPLHTGVEIKRCMLALKTD